MPEKVEVIGPLSGGWFAISENGIVGQARFPDQSSGWLAWREYSTRTLAAAAKPSPKKRRMY